MKVWTPRRRAKTGRRSARLARRLAAALALGSAALGTLAEARTVKIVTAQTLELRNVDGQELVIISGAGNQSADSSAPEAAGVELQVDDDLVRARRVEFNRTRRTLTLIGAASYRTAKDGQTLRGDNLVVDLGTESLTGQDVLISDRELEIRGEDVERVPGQLRANKGYFTPCAKCGRTTNDYAFRAERLVVYPGDRLIAYRAQLLVAEVPVLYLPVVVLPLNDEARQPKVQVGRDAVDGLTVEADLPFAVGSSVLGTGLLRYYQNRAPSLGGGVDLRAYAPFAAVDRADLYLLLLPRPLDAQGKVRGEGGLDTDLNFSVRGRVPLSEATRDLDYVFTMQRRDIGRSDTDPERGVTRSELRASVEYPRYRAELNVLGRSGPEPQTAVTQPYEKKEVVLDPKPFTVPLPGGDLSADFKVTAGEYSAASNPFSPSAVRQGPNITTTRLEEAHELRYSRPLWTGASFEVSNSFVGRYYGTGARTVQLSASGQLTQRWGVQSRQSLSLRQEYLRYEGTGPFAFDAVSGRRLSAPLSLNLNTVPVPDTTFTVGYVRDPFLKAEHQQPARFGVTVGRRPLNLNAALAYRLGTGELDSFTYAVTLGDPESGQLRLVPAVPAQPATPTTPAQPARPAYYQRSSAWPAPRLTLGLNGGYARVTSVGTPDKAAPSGLQPFTVRATVAGDDRSSNFSVSATFDPDLTPLLSSVGAEYSLVRGFDTVLSPLTVSGRETLGVQFPRVTGTHSVTWRDYTLTHAHDLNLDQAETARDSGTVSFSVGNRAGRATNWQLAYGGAYDLRRGGFTRPALTGTLTTSRPGQRLNTSLSYNLPGLDQPHAELGRAALDGEWQRGRFSVSGYASYTRVRSGAAPEDKPTDTYTFEPLRLGVALGKAEQPSVYLTAALRQRLVYVDGQRQGDDPLAPVLGFTLDRCCWAMQGEWDVVKGRYRLTVGLPGQFYPLLEGGPEGTRVPLIPSLSRPADPVR